MAKEDGRIALPVLDEPTPLRAEVKDFNDETVVLWTCEEFILLEDNVGRFGIPEILKAVGSMTDRPTAGPAVGRLRGKEVSPRPFGKPSAFRPDVIPCPENWTKPSGWWLGFRRWSSSSSTASSIGGPTSATLGICVVDYPLHKGDSVTLVVGAGYEIRPIVGQHYLHQLVPGSPVS